MIRLSFFVKFEVIVIDLLQNLREPEMARVAFCQIENLTKVW